MENKIVVFKIEAHADNLWEDSGAAKQPSVVYMDHKKWDTSPSSNEYPDDEFYNQKSILEMVDTDQMLGVATTMFKEAKLSVATAMTVAPLRVMMEYQMFPDEDIEMDAYDDYYPDYSSTAWTENLAARPHSGGKWFHHIFITHRSKSRRVSKNPPEMTVLRILEDGTLVQMMNGEDGKGQFVVSEIKKDVVSITSFIHGGETFFMTASQSSYPSAALPHSEYSVVEAFRIQEKTTAVTGIGEMASLEALSLNQKIEVFNVVKVVQVDFMTHTLLAVLDTAEEAASSSARLRIYNFNPSASHPSAFTLAIPEVFIFVSEISLDDSTFAPSIPFTDIHSFESKDEHFVVLVKAGVAILYTLESDGNLDWVRTYNSNADLVDMVPVVVGNFEEDIELMEVSRTSSGVTECKMLTYDGEGWDFDVTRTLSMSQSITGTTSLTNTAPLAPLMRMLGVHVGKSGTDGAQLNFGLFAFPTVPKLKLNRNLQQESEIYPSLYSLAVNDPNTRVTDASQVSGSLDGYLAKSGSVVTGDWNLRSVEVGALEAQDIPDDTFVTVNIKTGADDASAGADTGDFRDALDIDMATVESHLDSLSSNLASLQVDASDLLMKDSTSSQTVDGSIIIDGTLATSGDLLFSVSGDANDGFILSTLSNIADTASIALDTFTNIFSLNQNPLKILGNTDFQGKVGFSGDVQTTNLDSDLRSEAVVAANVLKYTGGQTIGSVQTFSGSVIISGDLALDADVPLSKSAFSIGVTDIPHSDEDHVISRGFTFSSNVVVENTGVSAPNFEDLSVSFADELTHIALKFGQADHIMGTLTLSAEESQFSTQGTRVGVVDGSMNNQDVRNIFQHCAWVSAPASIDTMNIETVLSFTTNVEFGEVQLEVMPAASQSISYISSGATTSTLLSEFVREDNPGGVYNVGGNKIFDTIASFDDVVAVTINSKTMDQFITKDSEQSMSGAATFSAPVSVSSIVGADVIDPIVEEKDLALYFSTDFDVFSSIDESTLHFSTMIIPVGASLEISGTINTYDVQDRVDNIVRWDEDSVEISGDKVVAEEMSAVEVKVDDIYTDYDGLLSSYGGSYSVEDFVNILTYQYIASGKMNH